ncbi:MAG: hypothetical protein QN163_03275 [Armatimonadota bacterium]|nr:hypothetical protein [Armatimonadota bacterium]MDR5696666.1 hypothetical protein [Armatimonadota bacterium]
MTATTASRLAPVVIGLCVLLAGAAQAHNVTVPAALTPPGGSTITAASTQLTATFVSDCGIPATVSATATSGTVTAAQLSCFGALWTWNGTWSGYASGQQTVAVTFLQQHGNPANPDQHVGVASATYIVILPQPAPSPRAERICRPGWQPPVRTSAPGHVTRAGATLPIKFCSTGSAASYRITIQGPGGTMTVEAHRLGNGNLYQYLLRTRGMRPGDYTVTTDAPGVYGPGYFALH